ncbi:MlaC/ttg2D family ABC transporter substrate-binding protein [Ideonella dechloratans]|uniref:MlaC/ttg2D family ABC transporter substrate-binding protein n=1 Tax=Ideonella dechloratans TaxID=36863 RepID=UPI0035AEBB3F
MTSHTPLFPRTAIVLTIAAASAVLPTLHAETLAPDVMIRQLSTEVIDAVKGDKAIQAGDIGRINALVDAKVMPVVDFQRMTASAVGRYWRTATPDQKKRLQDEFKTLLVRTYAGALSQVRDQTVALKPLRAAPTDTEVVVRTEIRGRGDPIQLDYRLEKDGDSWRIYDVNVLGVWLVEQYKNSFAQEINASGIDGLITKLAEKNKAVPAKG